MSSNRDRHAGGFTLIELLVVVAIVAIVSAATLPTILTAVNHRQISDAARTLQATLQAARDSAARSNAPQGLRFLRDKALTDTRPNVLAFSSMVPIILAPDYSEGTVSVLPPINSVGPPIVFNSPYTANNLGLFVIFGPTSDKTAPALPGPPTAWYWNIRRGEKIRINGAGPYYTIVGPTLVPQGPNNPEGFINEGQPGTVPSGPTGAGGAAEFLVLTNGMDDNGNGFIDEGFDGVDNDGNSFVDDLTAGSPPPSQLYPSNHGVTPNYPYSNDPNETETESSTIPIPNFSFYTIVRRPVMNERARVVTLPTDVVIDATTFNTTQERSLLPLDPNVPLSSTPPSQQYFDIVFYPNGQVRSSSPFAGTASQLSIPTVPFYHFWLTEREGMADPFTAVSPFKFTLPMPAGTTDTAGTTSYPSTLPLLKGERRLVSLNTRSGLIMVTQIEQFALDDLNLPYRNAQAGVKDKP